MAINKKLIHFNKKTTFNSQKLSANASNTQYQVGGTGTVQTGAPDINYQSIVYIKDSKEIWTHGQFYGSAASVAWSAITGKPSFATVATSGSYNDLSNKPTIPTSLPTPNSLTFTGATTGTWNGSAAKTVNIPTYSEATTSTSGLMSSSDKTKLNSLASNMIKSRNSYVQCNMSDDNIDVYAPGCNVTVQSDIFLVTSPQVEFNENVSIMNGSLNLVSGDITTQSGSISSTGGFFDISDARAKTNVKEIDASKADKVKLVEFDRTDVEHHGYGVIAQELEKVYPEMVNTDDEGFKSVNYNELAMVKIKYLEDKVARLEALVGRLLAE